MAPTAIAAELPAAVVDCGVGAEPRGRAQSLDGHEPKPDTRPEHIFGIVEKSLTRC